MQLSVIILNYNVEYFLEQCVLSVQKALKDIDAEIIVIDNNSSDGSCAMMKAKFPMINLIENDENLGFPKGNNIGVAQAKGDYICILNPDTVVAEDTFLKILNFCQTEPVEVTELGIIGCKLIDGTGNFLPESKRGVPTPWVAFTKIFGLYKWFPTAFWFNQYYAQHLSENQSGKVDILVGAFMLMKRDLYLKVGGFDEKCFMYSDDIDLSYMIKKLGKQNYYCADATVIHYKGESTVRDEKYLKRFKEAMQFFYKKHFKKSMVFDIMMQIGSFVFSFFKQNQQASKKQVIESYVYFSKSLKEISLQKPVKQLAALSDFKNELNHTIEVIFDTSSFSFLEIIQFMENNSSKNITYKNYFPQSNYMIGSNNAIDRGEIVHIK
jgi:GT2 family glycosyltransferase